MRRFSAVIGVLIALVVAPPAVPAPDEDLIDRIVKLRKQTWHWQRVMGRRVTPASPTPLAAQPALRRRSELELWRARAKRVRKTAARPPRLAAWRCIQRHEGPWRAATGNGYYGGLQMDYAFMRRYGRYLLRTKGTANRWTPLEQIWVAERAYRSGLGFRPWPNTARACGVL